MMLCFLGDKSMDNVNVHRVQCSMISEKMVCGTWQSPIACDLITDKGEHFRKIYAGRPVSGPGCDYQDAIFSIDGNLMLGDVEVHVDAREWYLHGHHRDERYNNVALHVVMWHSGSIPTVLENGRTIPTVSLHSLIERPSCMPAVENEQHRRGCPFVCGDEYLRKLHDVLRECGMRRFNARVLDFHQALAKENAGQVLYRGMMGALGYSRNTSPFEKLADVLPLDSLLGKKDTESTYLLALMLGSAGLLAAASSRAQEVRDLDCSALYKLWKKLGKEPDMEKYEWYLFGIRPGNNPLRRMAAAAELLMRYRGCGLVEGMCRLVRDAPAKGFRQHLEQGIVVGGEAGSGTKGHSALLGRGRAAEIVINVILPFVHAYAGTNGEKALAGKALRLYAIYPATEQNYISRLMGKNLGLGAGKRLDACRLQGLIYVFKTYCRFRDCAGCLLANSHNNRGGAR